MLNIFHKIKRAISDHFIVNKNNENDITAHYHLMKFIALNTLSLPLSVIPPVTRLKFIL